MKFKTLFLCIAFSQAFSVAVFGQHELGNSDDKKTENSDALKQMAAIRKPDDIGISLFASEPNVKNPVAFYVDFRGKVFVCESFRQEKGIEDNRGHQHWLLDDLAAQTVDDRLAYIKKHLGEKAEDYTKNDDRIRLLIDSDKDGVVDKTTVFSNGYNTIVSGTGAGVLNYQGDVYFTCIPDLWLLKDNNDDGVADTRTALHTGFGVRFAFRGHDMHGLVIGPDGRLYFSIGDRGYNVQTKDGLLADPASGAVFRCELDGSNLEVVHTGLRNPQELAFDNYGNLFTGDNNSDSGDKARWVYVVPGGDSGWRMYYQYLSDRGPFNREKIWHPFHADTPAYIVPPVDNLSDGPSGLTFYPGTGFGDRFKDCFFLCDFRGQSSNSGIRTFRVANEGAFFRIVDSEQPVWQVLATDADFGPDGKLYVSDWVHGWTGEEKGRIYTFFDAQHQDSKIVKDVEQLLRSGFHDRTDLEQLIDHADRRVRQEAQFELVRQIKVDQLEATATNSEMEFGRYHAIWGLSQLARNGKLEKERSEKISLALLADDDEEIQYQAMSLVADARLNALSLMVAEKLSSGNDRVRYGAALCLGRLGERQFADKVFELLASNADKDPMLRHAGIMALVWFNDQKVLDQAIAHPSASVRLASVVAMRKLRNPNLAKALNDADSRIVLEAARAIHDLNIQPQMHALASLANRVVQPDALMRRIMNANFRLGGKENAMAIVEIATNPAIDEDRRIDALDMLAAWNNPKPLDRVSGQWRPLENRAALDVKTIVKNALPKLVAIAGKASTKALRVAGELEITDVKPLLHEIYLDTNRDDDSRAAALAALVKMRSERREEFVVSALNSDSQILKQKALELAPAVIPDTALKYVVKSLGSQQVSTKQTAIASLGQLDSDDADKVLLELAEKLNVGELQKELELDVWQQVNAKQAKLGSIYTQLHEKATSNEHSKYLYSQFGGNAERGHQIFFQRASTYCLRCHKVDGQGGEVGPDLSEIAKTKNREYLLNSIINPNKDIAENFETVIVLDIDGRTHTGTLKADTDQHVELITAEGNRVIIQQEDIDDIAKTKSSMPEDLTKDLSPADVRDLVEFLSQRK